MSESIGFVGAGNMAEAMIRGLLRGDVFKPKHITASAPRQERRDELSEKYGIHATASNAEAAGQAIVVLSVEDESLKNNIDERVRSVDADSLVIVVADRCWTAAMTCEPE